MSNTSKNSDEGNPLEQEVKVFIEYGVSKNEQETALQVLDKYRNNQMLLAVLRDFYSRLPECREEAVLQIRRIISRMGFYLLEVTTESFAYIYFYNGEDPYYIGEKKDGIQDSEVLSFFGYGSNKELLFELNNKQTNAGDTVNKSFCPACSVESGQFHQFGCPVEICPWCDGQFTYCNCRFEQLGLDEITEERELDRLEIILNEKGRIPFSSGHAPSYPTGGTDSEDE